MTMPTRACDDFHRTDAERDRWPAPLTRRQVLAAGIGAGADALRGQAMPLDARARGRRGRRRRRAERARARVGLPARRLRPARHARAARRLRALRRPAPALKVAAPLPLGGTGLGLHPSLGQGLGGGVKGLFERGQIGFLPGIDYANPDLSHFHSRHFWETGLITERVAPGLARALARPPRRRRQPAPGAVARLRALAAPALGAARRWPRWPRPATPQLGCRGVWGERLRPRPDSLRGAWPARAARRPGPARPRARRGSPSRSADRLAPYAEHDGDADPLAPPVAYPARTSDFARAPALPRRR